MLTTRTNLNPPKTLTASARARVIEDLADFLLDERPTASRLDTYGRKLALPDPAFARLLGVGVSTLRRWRHRGRVPEKGASQAHAALTSNGALGSPTASGKPAGGELGGGRSLASQNGHKTPKLETLAGVLAATRGAVPRPSPEQLAAWPELGLRGRAAGAYICRLHAPEPGDAYAACECPACR